MNEEWEVVGTAKQGRSLATWPLLAVTALALVGLAVPLIRGMTTVATPVAAIDAYEQIGPGMVTTKSVWRHGLDETDVVRDADATLGDVAATALTPGTAIHSDDLIEPATAEALDGVLLELQPEVSSALGVEAGDEVILRFAPLGEDSGLHPVVVPGLLLGQSGADDGTNDFVVVVAPEDADEVAELAARSALLVSPAD